MSDYYLGIDLGGSGIRAGLVNTEGTMLLNLPEINFEQGSLNAQELTVSLVDIFGSAFNTRVGKQITAIGIGSPGPLNPMTGVIECPPNLKINSFPVIEILGKYFPKIPAFLINDADAAILGETWKGVAKPFKDVVMLTLGTGVGSGVMAGGRLQRGRGKGAEWGHTTIYANGERRLCSCGNFNCLEAFVGTVGFNKIKNLKNGADIYCSHLVEGIRNIICVHNPECIVLGGGIIQNNKYLFDRVKENLLKTDNQMVSLIKGTKIGLAKLKRSGVIGAAKHAIDCYEVTS